MLGTLSVLYSTLPVVCADDIKLCLQNMDTSCQSNFQSDLNNFQTWCSDILLDLNGTKCKVITFCRVNPQYAIYTLSEGSLDRIILVNNLGVLLNPRLTFGHISSVENKGRGALGFIKGILSKEFDDPFITRTFFIQLMLIVWNT